MNTKKLKDKLSKIDIGDIEYFDSIDSTNRLAGEWLEKYKPNYSVIVADEQVQGRGRMSRTWVTPKNSALAFSLLYKEKNADIIPFLSGIAAVSIIDAIKKQFPSLNPEIKWPNDILINKKKVAGILIESSWLGDDYLGSIVGIGINIAPGSVPTDQALRFPASCLEIELAQSIDRWELLQEILIMLQNNLSNIYIPKMLTKWEDNLAYKDEQIALYAQEKMICEGLLLGLNDSGAIRILIEGEGVKTFDAGEISLRSSTMNQ